MAIKISDLDLSLPEGVTSKLLTSIRPYNIYKGGERTDALGGYTYEICFPELRYEKLSVKVPIECQPLPILNIDEEPLPVGAPVKIDGLEITSYFSKGTINITAKAKRISLETAPSPKGA